MKNISLFIIMKLMYDYIHFDDLKNLKNLYLIYKHYLNKGK